MVALENRTEGALLEAELRRFCTTAKKDTPILPERRLASRYGITHGAVRKVLDRLLVDGLITRQQGRGTFVARDPVAADALTIIQIDTWQQLSHPYYVARLQGIMAEAKQHRLRVQILPGPHVETAEFYADVAHTDVGGVIVPYASPQLEAGLRQANPRLAIVTTGYVTADTTMTHVVVDYQSLGAMAAAYLLRRGARRPFAVCGHREAQSAFLVACETAGVPGETAFVEPKGGDPTAALAQYRRAAADGLAFDDDVIAGAVLRELQPVPRRLITQANRGACLAPASAARLEMDGQLMGRTIVQTLHAMIRHGLYHNTIVRLRPTLVEPLAQAPL